MILRETMKINVLSLEGKELKKADLPSQFNEEIREDLVQRAVLALQANRRQKYGADPEAGKRQSGDVSRRRRDYRGSYGKGISRVPRKIFSIRGSHISWQGAFAPGTVGGRRSHPPKVEKNWDLKVNKKENQKAIRCALSAVVNKDLVIARGHKAPDNYPFIVESKIESVKKAKDFALALKALGLQGEMKRTEDTSVRAGRGKTRGRRLKRKRGALIVVSDWCDLTKNQNIQGFDVVRVQELNAEMLAPGGDLGRLTVFTEKALEKLAKYKMFI